MTMTATVATREPAYLIGDVAKAAGVAVETVRRWHREGLVPPPARTPGGLRVYSAADLEEILRLREARAANTRHAAGAAA